MQRIIEKCRKNAKNYAAKRALIAKAVWNVMREAWIF
jgi:hypothetical protein